MKVTKPHFFWKAPKKYLGIQHLPNKSGALFGLENLGLRVGCITPPSEDNAQNTAKPSNRCLTQTNQVFVNVGMVLESRAACATGCHCIVSSYCSCVFVCSSKDATPQRIKTATRKHPKHQHKWTIPEHTHTHTLSLPPSLSPSTHTHTPTHPPLPHPSHTSALSISVC